MKLNASTMLYIFISLYIIYILLNPRESNINKPKRVTVNENMNTTLFFDDTKFDAKCCPSTYTSSNGCACMSDVQKRTIETRGGNDPYY